MKNTNILILVFTILFFFNFSSCKKKGDQILIKKQSYEINFIPAKTNNELAAIRADKNNNLIRTLSDFDKIIIGQHSPLSKLPNQVIAEFRSQLTIRDSIGIVGLKYSTIINLLNDDEFAQTMTLFGLDTKNGFWGFSKNKKVISKMHVNTKLRDESTQSVFFEDYVGYECVSAHNCSRNSDYICLSGC